MKTAKEILKPYYQEFDPDWTEPNQTWYCEEDVIEAMEEYASQLKPDAKEFGKITEQDLKNAIKRIKQDKPEDERLRERY